MESTESAVAIPTYGITSPEPLETKETTPGRTARLRQLDFVRGLAILLVIGYHSLTIPTTFLPYKLIEAPFKQFGWSGVDLFFVLSGFLVGGLLIGEYASRGTIRVGRFIKRRGFKIWPAYYAYLLFHVITHHFPLSSFLLANLLHIQNYVGTSLAHTWTLAVEEHFYLLLPFLLVFLTRSARLKDRIPQVLIGICIATLLLRSWMVLALGSTRVWEYTHTRLDSLMFGVLLSYLYKFRPILFDRLKNNSILLVALSVSGLTFLSLVSDTSPIMRTVGYTINYLAYGSFLLLMLRAEGGWTRTWVYRFISWIGVYSYSVYLWHVSVRSPVLAAVLHLQQRWRWPVLLLLQFACAVGLGVVMAKLIEWPFLRFRERILPSAS